ncbi:hypothetical protein [Arthrobacter psychrochitiniphilus]|uniref:hypothetical protein n=1 Tax=Arthrobacter psychrochitiniphilus TaxID=291045 RepID=UPI0011B54AF9|nr:hypothetical protein [Arthrobacter psychrochitiniphilus]NYG18404.1 hypothetical protein [Arthrobacter psychrochitiniphilus]
MISAESVPQRPALERSLTGTEFSRWYWLKTELPDFARSYALVSTALERGNSAEPSPRTQESRRASAAASSCALGLRHKWMPPGRSTDPCRWTCAPEYPCGPRLPQPLQERW